MENEDPSRTSDKIKSVNNAEANGNNKKIAGVSGSSESKIAKEVASSNSSKKNKNAKPSTSDKSSQRTSTRKSVTFVPNTNDTSNETNSTIKPESQSDGTTLDPKKSKNSGTVATPGNNRKSITSGQKGDKIRTKSSPRTRTSVIVVEKRTPEIKRCTISCNKGIKDADVKNIDGQGKCVQCELEKTIERNKRVRSGGTGEKTCVTDCGRSSSKERAKRGQNVQKLKCAKSLECKKVICSTCPKRSDEDENGDDGGGEGEGNVEETETQKESQGSSKKSTEKEKKRPPKRRKLSNVCKLCSCCGKQTGKEDKTDNETENESEEENGTQRKKRKGRKKKRKYPYKRFPEGKKPPCAGKSNNMIRFYGRRPACHAGYGMCHPCHPLYSPA